MRGGKARTASGIGSHATFGATVTARIRDLLHHCVRSGEWEPAYDGGPVIGLLEELATEESIKRHWEPETAYYVLLSTLNHHKDEALKSIAADLTQRFARTFMVTLAANPALHIFVVPLLGATCRSVIHFGRFLIIPAALPRREKLTLLARRLHLSVDDLDEFATHTERSRSPDFYNLTLFCIQVRHQTAWVRHWGRALAWWHFALLRTLFYADHYRHYPRHLEIRPAGKEPQRNVHLAILARDRWRCGHAGLGFAASFPFSLDWLTNRTVQRQLEALSADLVLASDNDKLSRRFLRAINLLNSSIDALAGHGASDGLGLPTLFLMIAAESIFLERGREKQQQLSYFLATLGRPPRTQKRDAFAAVEECYRWRSSFVHSGTDISPEYDEDLKEGKSEQQLYLVREMVARAIRAFPGHQRRLQRARTGEEIPRETRWLSYLRQLWIDSLTR